LDVTSAQLEHLEVSESKVYVSQVENDSKHFHYQVHSFKLDSVAKLEGYKHNVVYAYEQDGPPHESPGGAKVRN